MKRLILAAAAALSLAACGGLANNGAATCAANEHLDSASGQCVANSTSSSNGGGTTVTNPCSSGQTAVVFSASSLTEVGYEAIPLGGDYSSLGKNAWHSVGTLSGSGSTSTLCIDGSVGIIRVTARLSNGHYLAENYSAPTLETNVYGVNSQTSAKTDATAVARRSASGAVGNGAEAVIDFCGTTAYPNPIVTN